jgi:hypothetical protein
MAPPAGWTCTQRTGTMGEDGGRFITERVHQTTEARDGEEAEHRANHDRDVAEQEDGRQVQGLQT